MLPSSALDTHDHTDHHGVSRPTLMASQLNRSQSPIPDLSPEAKQDHRLIARPTAGQRLRVRRQSMRQVVAALLDELDRLLRRPRSCEASRWRSRPRNEVLEEAVGLIWKLVADDEASTPSRPP